MDVLDRVAILNNNFNGKLDAQEDDMELEIVGGPSNPHNQSDQDVAPNTN